MPKSTHLIRMFRIFSFAPRGLATGSWSACPHLGGDSQLLSDTVSEVTFRNDIKYEIQRAAVSPILTLTDCQLR